jgi:hypothetical protein
VGLFNGVLIGLALALGTWGLEALSLIRLPLPLAHGSLILGTLMLVLLCGLSGLLSSRMNWTWLTVILWTVAGMIASLIIGYQPSFGRSLVIWLVDWRFWGIPVYPVPEGSYWGLIVLGGLFIILVFIVLALLQGQRLDAAQRELKEKARMSRRAWWMLLAPLPLVAVAGWATGSMLLNPAASAANVVYDAIETTRDYEGDLFALGLERGANYAAVRAVHDRMTENYTLHVGEIDPASSTAFVLVEFENGAWINCRTINDQLSFCYDASPPYTTGLASLISGEPVPEDCLGCLPRVEEETADWLRQQGDVLGDNLQIERLAQWGGYVLMGVRSEAGDQALECWFSSMSPVVIEHCETVTP